MVMAMKISLNSSIDRTFKSSFCHFEFLIRQKYKINVMAVVCNYILLFGVHLLLSFLNLNGMAE